jgi:4-hydroxybenzoate polyprenyltransferase
MGDRISGVFGFGACTFLVFTIFDAYRTAELKARKQLESSTSKEPLHQDNTIIAWGIFLILLGILFLLQNIINYYFLNQLWPLVFIFLGLYLVYRALHDRKATAPRSPDPLFRPKEDR